MPQPVIEQTVPLSLQDWLERIQRLHPRGIEMGLERLGTLVRRLRLQRPARYVITVAGTNGKGSTCAFLEAVLRAQGYRVGLYTSPHILCYRERVRLDGQMLSEQGWIDAFEEIERTRDGISLTYFEYTTLAALWIFNTQALDAAILEVGLGGRLDAVNTIDADASVVTTVDLDHQEFLGNDRETIALEKAGVFRPGKPAISAEPNPPRSLLAYARGVDARLWCLNRDYGYETEEGGRWLWRCRDCSPVALPPPSLLGQFQYQNAAGALAVLQSLQEQLPTGEAAWQTGIGRACVPGRLQRVAGNPDVWVDVAHNPQAAMALAEWLEAQPNKRWAAVFAALADKDVESMFAALKNRVAAWYVFGLAEDTPRGLGASALYDRLRTAFGASAHPVSACGDAQDALSHARAFVGKEGGVIVFGSFYAVSIALRALGADTGCTVRL